MKRKLLFILMTLLPMVAVTTLTSCGDDEENDDTIVNPSEGNNYDGSNNNDDNSNQKDLNIIVTVDANGNANGEHQFVKINETNFYIDGIKYTATDGELAVTGNASSYFLGNAKIIKTLKYNGQTMDVTSIKKHAFFKCEDLVSIIIPTSMKSIVYEAFYRCNNLTSVTIGGVTDIDSNAFSGCDQIEKVFVPDLATWCGIQGHFLMISVPHCYIGEKEVTEITSVVIPNNVTSIDDYTFSGWIGLTSVTIPNSVTSIGGSAFWYCRSLTSITIPNSVTSIGWYTFGGAPA